MQPLALARFDGPQQTVQERARWIRRPVPVRDGVGMECPPRTTPDATVHRLLGLARQMAGNGRPRAALAILDHLAEHPGLSPEAADAVRDMRERLSARLAAMPARPGRVEL